MRFKSLVLKGFLILFMLLILANFYYVNAALTTEDLWSASSGLGNIQQGVEVSDADAGIVGAINTVIGLFQIAGTGISVIMVSMLGIKYILASIEEKAEIKKMAMPILIGAVLLFGAVNLIGVIENFSNSVINTDN